MPEWFHLRRFLRHFDVDCVFDVGANRGQYARMLRDKANFRGDIISFEPIPQLTTELEKISTSDARWHVAGIALDRESGPATFNVMADLEFSSFLRPSALQPTIFKSKNRISKTITVNRSTIAEQFVKYQQRLGFKRPFLKMDTQGNDLAVVDGAGSSINLFVGIQTELSVQQIYNNGPDLTSSMKRFADLGFAPSAFVPNNEGHFPELIEIDCIFFRRTQVRQN